MQNWIIDVHLDLGWNALQWNRDITQSVYTIRTLEAGMTEKGRAMNTVALPEMRAGKVMLCFATLMGRSTGVPVHHVDFNSPMQTFGIARGHLAYYRALEQRGYVRIITDGDGLDTHINTINDDDAPLGFIISMESADAILAPSDMADWVDAGVRVIGPAHYGMGRYAGGTGVEDGFTDIGFELLNQIEQHNVILDVTHLSDLALDQALDTFGGHILASHSNARTLVPHQRQFSDVQIMKITERGGVLGAAFDNWMLVDGWIKGQSSPDLVSLSTVVDHIDHICQLVGNADHVGIGTDLDGGYGREQSPHDLNTIADLQNLIPLFQQRGYSEDDIEGILHNNFLRVIRSAWGA